MSRKRILAELRDEQEDLGRPSPNGRADRVGLVVLRPEQHQYRSSRTRHCPTPTGSRSGNGEYVKQHGAVSKDEFIGIVLGNTLGMAGAKETVARYVASVPKAE